MWIDDGAPAGATWTSKGGGLWSWAYFDPSPFSRLQDLQSDVTAGQAENDFVGFAGDKVNAGDHLFAYVFIDAAHPTSEIMLQWYDGSGWEHRAYWGSDQINLGTDHTAGRFYAGSLPQTNGWLRLDVTAASVGLVGSTVTGIALTQYGGRVSYDYAGLFPAP